LTASASRDRLVALALERDALVIPAHLPAPHAGRAQRSKTGITFDPLKTA